MATYDVEGSILEACSCSAPCPCWIGDDPHGGRCDSFVAYRIDRGMIRGVDVSGLAFAFVARIPGNVLKGNWTAAVYVTDRATPEQKAAILDVWTGKCGGPLADLAALMSVEKAASWGRRVTAPAGVLLALWGLGVLARVPGIPAPF